MILETLGRLRASAYSVVVLVAVALALTACGGDGTSAAKPKADGFVAPDVSAADPAPVAQSVGTSGGAVEHASGAKLKVPAGALPADVELTMQAAAPPPAVQALGTPIGAALLLGPEGQTFLVPVQIALPVDPAVVASVDPALLQVVLAPAGSDEFVGLETQYDPAAKVLLAETTHFSIAVPTLRKAKPLAVDGPAAATLKVGEALAPLGYKAVGGTAPVAYALSGGALPPGVALAADGKISGTPTQAGKFAATLRATDGKGEKADKALALEVEGPPNPAPTLDAVAPSSAIAGAADTPITLTGKEFLVGALVTINGKGVPTTRSGATALQAKLPAAQLAAPGTLQIGAVNPGPGGGPSAQLLSFVVTEAQPSDAGGSDAEDGGSGDGSGDGDSADGGADDAADVDGAAEVDSAADASPACTPSPETCDGQDNDCNGQTDEPACCAIGDGKPCDDGSVCTSGEKCAGAQCLGGEVTACSDDGNPCTDDGCDAKAGCNFSADGAPCNDGKACTQGDQCSNKGCIAGKDSLCNDGNPCTADTCDEAAGCAHLAIDGACDDGDGCSVGEACDKGTCGGATAKDCDDGKPCTLDSCDPKSGSCANAAVPGCGDPCQQASDCKDDGNPCTLADCATNACAVVVQAGACSDGDPCTSGDACADGACKGLAATCDDGNACTADSCGADGKCAYAAAAGGCEDGNACTVLEVCKDSQCVAGGPAQCDDGNACTDDGCDPKSGCTHPDSATPCSDGDACSVGDACKGGSCVASGPKDCDDGKGCTLDSCDAQSGACLNKPIPGCGDFCETPKDCKDDGNPCTEWDCKAGDPAGTCSVVYLSGPCTDSDACTESDTCDKGACIGTAVNCDDGNGCSDDSCDKALGCVFTANTAACSDGKVCTLGDVCKDKLCVPGAAPDCDDQNACTFDTCHPKAGCTHSAEGLTCSDDNPCTLGDSCIGDKCVGGEAKVCDDGNACTIDACEGATGKCGFAAVPGCGAPCGSSADCQVGSDPCVVLACGNGVCAASATTATCDDGNTCTANDGCASGKCTGKLDACDDGNACTIDSCSNKLGCAHGEQAGAACEDGNLCTVQDQCQKGGVCKAGLTQQCADDNPCTADACDPKVGCQYAALQVPCSDGDPCTLGDTCAKGACLAGDPSPCDDGNGCTADACDAKAGCGHAAIKGCGSPCQADGDCGDDGNPCTAQVCSGGSCAVQPASGPCDDGNPCTAQDSCANGKCGGSPANCSDGNPCSDDACDPKSGCTHSANTAPCALGNACNSKDFCKDMACSPGTPVSCDDGNACTLDTCDPDAGCQHTDTAQPCDDGSPCSKNDQCADGACIGGDPLPCDDGDSCTSDLCDTAKGGCVFVGLPGCGSPCQSDKECPDDGNVCTEAVCAAGTCVVAFIAAPCDDKDPCSAADLCSEGACQGTESACDDGNPCTADACPGGKGCSNTAQAGPCDDGSACTSGDACDKGLCKGAKLLVCDDGNPCTTDACDPGLGCASSDNKAPCQDGNPCTDKDSCAGGVCQAGAVVGCDDGKACTLDVCDLASGKCKSSPVVGCGGNCAISADCQADSDPCTDAVCQGGVCGLALNATGCDDGNACTSGDTCQKGLCLGKTADCDDGNACTADSCDAAKGCVTAPAAGACDDGNACTAGEACASGQCSGGKPVDCADANLCTDDSCSPQQGCVQLPNQVTCDDDNPCSAVDKCNGTYCMGSIAKDCDDQNPCTNDGCSTAKGCVHSASSAGCDDGDACTQGDQCAQGNCAAGKAVNCNDANACTADSCDPQAGCKNAPASGGCDDGDACTVGDGCVLGECLAGQAKDCSDGNPCTTDACDKAKGCSSGNNTLACDDGDACTQGDACKDGACGAGAALGCNDNNPCTDDSCSKLAGCKNAPNTKPCSDGDACTTLDSCALGVCVGGAAPNCADGNPCTGESCDKAKGCVMLALDATCSDGSACTLGDTCKDGDCVPGKAPNCDDDNVCTDDACDKAKGCTNLPNAATCSDGSACTKDDGCGDGKCVAGAALGCDDKNPCTDDSCDAVKGCANVNSTKACDDGDACTKSDTCSGGGCAAQPVTCNDGNGCTFDTCDSAKGCVFANTADGCDDGDACTAPDLCKAGVCAAGAAVSCDDNNVCTSDSCDKQKGCVSTNNTSACDDGSVCITGETCSGGKCAGTAVSCDDKNACTDDSCDAKSGCSNKNNTQGCSDGDACTSGDKCANGACVAGAVVSCDDNNACTNDSCDKASGCQNAANSAPCDDKDACTSADQCKDKACAGAPLSCDDGNACSDDACDKATGCKHTANSASSCSDGNACTSGDACASGKCAGTPVDCKDGSSCTVDVCKPTSGCSNTPNAALCDDGNPCTTDTCDPQAGCKTANAADGTACTSADTCAGSPTCKAGVCSGKAAYYRRDLATAPSTIDKTATGYVTTGQSNPSQPNTWYMNLTDLNFNSLKQINLSSVVGATSSYGVKEVKVASDGSLLVAGLKQPPSGTSGPLLAVFDASGKLKWQKDWAAVMPYEASFAVTEFAGGVAVTMGANACRVAAFDTAGNSLWEKNLAQTIPNNNNLRCAGVAPGPNGSLFVFGHRHAGTAVELFWRGYDAAGNETLSGSAHPCGNEYAVNVAYMDASQGWYGTAYCDGAPNDHSMVVKINPNGSYAGQKIGMLGAANWPNGCDAGRVVISPNGDLVVSNPCRNANGKWTGTVTRLNYAMNVYDSVALPKLQASEQVNTPYVTATADSIVAAVTVSESSTVGSLFKMAAPYAGTGLPNYFMGSWPSCPTYACAGVTCNDGVACTVDSCHPTNGCVYTKTDALCDDGQTCTADSCDAVKGCQNSANAAAACHDNNPCTDDTCDPVKGCANPANSAPCSDGDACTTADSCVAKACVGGPAKDCEDGVACTSHSCDKTAGCKQTADNAKCDDGKLCTADTCDIATGCLYAADTKLCDDGNICTDDSCDNAKGCTKSNNTAVCDDGNACTVAEACAGGACKGGAAKVCDDAKECTSDACDPAKGCVVSNKAGGTSCTPSTSCSTAATCDGGGGCSDGPSKYWVKYLDNGPWTWNQASMTVPADGGGPIYVRTNTAQEVGTVVRTNTYGQGQWSVETSDRRYYGARSSVWKPNEFLALGRQASSANAVVEMRKTSDGSVKCQKTVNVGGNGGWFTDAAYENGGNDYLAMTAVSGSNGNAYAYSMDGSCNLGQIWKYEGAGDDQANGIYWDKNGGALVLGTTNSKGGTGYNAFYVRQGIQNDVMTVDNGGNEAFYGVISMGGALWAIGMTDGGGSPRVMAVRVEGGSQVVKTYGSLSGSGVQPVGFAEYGGKLYLAGPGATAASLDGNMDLLWQNNYPLNPLSISYRSISTMGGVLTFYGAGYNGQNGLTGIGIGRTDLNGVANCTDKNPCASLPPGGCDDGIACTADSCDVQKGCVHSPSNAMCDDGNPCTVNSCDAVKGCVYPVNSNTPCNDNNVCTIDSCDNSAKKCVFAVNAALACDDNNPCTDDLCANNQCSHLTASCDDGLVCTKDSCDATPGKGCQHVLQKGACDDGKACTVFDTCGESVYDYGQCVPKADVCAPASGAVLHTHAGVPTSIAAAQGKISAWYDVQQPVALVAPLTSKPFVTQGAVFDRDGVDLASSGMTRGFSHGGAWTLALVFRQGAAQEGSTLFSVGALKWRGLYAGGKLLLISPENVQIAALALTQGQSYILVVRLGFGEGKLMAYSAGAPQFAAGVVPSQAAAAVEFTLNKLQSGNPDANPVFGEVILYDKALSDTEVTALTTQLQQQWGLGACKQHADCDDSNFCTNDFCTQFPDKPWACTHDLLTLPSAGSCKDSNPCTIEEVCDKGVCVGSKPAPCDDKNPCTKDSCDANKGCQATPVSDGSLKCDDGDACTSEFCNPEGKCVASPKTCDDGNPCSDDSCDKASGCVFAANTAPCDDGNLCTSSDACKGKTCSGVANTVPCNDFHPCTTEDTCENGACTKNKPVVCPDSDNNACTVEVCSYFGGGCKIDSLKTCSDNNPCTDDACNTASGQCEFKNNQVPCSDGELCSLGDYCSGGSCTPGKLDECDDSNICTNDKCLSKLGCTHTVTQDCEDGDLCSEDDLCIFGSCLAGAPKNCDDGNACTVDWCEVPGGGCKHEALIDGSACSDGDLCTLPDSCQAGACKAGAKVCDYAVTKLTDDMVVVDGKLVPADGTLRDAVRWSDNAQASDKIAGKPITSRTILFFVAGKLTLKAPLNVVHEKVIDGGGDTVLIDGEGKIRLFELSGPQLTLKNLKLQNGMVTKASDTLDTAKLLAGRGALIGAWCYPWLEDAGKCWVTLDNCELYNGNSEYGGGAIFGHSVEVSVTGGNITKNYRTKGTGAQLPNGNLLYADGGGAIAVEEASKLNVTNVRFDYNSGPGPGSSVWCGGSSTCTISRASMFGGKAHSGAVGVAAGATASLVNVTITANEGYAIGTGIYSQGTLSLRHVTLDGCSALDEKTMPMLYVNGPTTIVNSIVSEAGAAATGLDCVMGPQAAMVTVASLITKSQNMPADWGPNGGGKACVGAGGAPANLKGQQLGANSVRTMEPNVGSPAIDKADLKACLAAPVSGKDALGKPRPKGNGCDMGALELGP